MADSINTVVSLAGDESALPAVTRATYNRQLLSRALPLLIHQKFGQTKELKRAQGQSMVFRRYESLAAATIPLTDGQTPNGTVLEKTDYVATVNFYGNFTVITDKIDLTWFDDVIGEASTLMGENEGESMDTVYREPLHAGTNWIRCITGSAYATSTSVRTAVVDYIQKGALDKAIRILDDQKARRFTPRFYGSDKVGSSPLDEAFWAIIHTTTIEDLYVNARSDLTVGTDFIPVQKYAQTVAVQPGEIGAYRNIRFIATTNAKVFPDSGGAASTTFRYTTSNAALDVYSTLILGRDAYGIVPIMTGNSRIIIHKAGSNADPLNQRNTVGWKAGGVSVILNDAWMLRIEHAVSV